jgi:RNA polymerase sigma-70 factor (ECF subfamily)
MTADPLDSPGDTTRLLQQAAAGDRQAWGNLLERHRERLRRMIAFRLDGRLQGRLDPSDVLQEAYLEASRRLEEYMARPGMPFPLWLRFLAVQKLLEQHRRHLGAQGRDAAREVSLGGGPQPEASSAVLAAHLVGNLTSPSEAAFRSERQRLLQDALERMDALDREVLVLRHFEQLSNGEAARVLGVDKSAASKRYARALVRLKDILAALPGGRSENSPCPPRTPNATPSTDSPTPS